MRGRFLISQMSCIWPSRAFIGNWVLFEKNWVGRIRSKNKKPSFLKVFRHLLDFLPFSTSTTWGTKYLLYFDKWTYRMSREPPFSSERTSCRMWAPWRRWILRKSDQSHAGSTGKQYRLIGHDREWVNNDTSAKQCSPHGSGICMLWVGTDTHYGIYDSGYRKMSFDMDTVGASASSQQTTVFILLCPSGMR